MTKGGTERRELLTMAQAIEILKTTRATFQRWLKAGRISGMKVGRQWRFEREEIDRFLSGEGAPLVESTVGRGDLFADLAGLFAETAGEPWPGPGDVADLVMLILDLAVRRRASDIHIDPRAGADPEVALQDEAAEASIRFRIDGVLQPIATFDLRLLPALVARLKALADCDVRERERPQDGRAVIRAGGGDALDLRLTFLPAALGECVTARILDPRALSFSFERIGLSGDNLDRVRAALAAPHGLILVTGPTGSGKTTTHYSCLSEIVRPDRKVMSVEDPVEYHLPGVVQVPVRSDLGLTFETLLRHVLRSDPDVVLVGEIRDRETMQMCCQASMTGHLVQTTLHTKSAVAALMRLIDLGIAPFLIAESTTLVLAQRIVRVLCPHCSVTCQPDPDVLEQALNLADAGCIVPASIKAEFRRPVGCPRCAAGYRGRVGIYEALEVTPEIGRGLREGASSEELLCIALRQGMRTMAADGLARAARGETTIDEILRIFGGG